MHLVLTLVCCVSKPALVCNNWLCTSLDVEAGLCNPLSKKKDYVLWRSGDLREQLTAVSTLLFVFRTSEICDESEIISNILQKFQQ
jgi:hypothetical protein